MILIQVTYFLQVVDGQPTLGYLAAGERQPTVYIYIYIDVITEYADKPILASINQRALVVMWIYGWTSKREAMGSNPTEVKNFATFFKVFFKVKVFSKVNFFQGRSWLGLGQVQFLIFGLDFQVRVQGQDLGLGSGLGLGLGLGQVQCFGLGFGRFWTVLDDFQDGRLPISSR